MLMPLKNVVNSMATSNFSPSFLFIRRHYSLSLSLSLSLHLSIFPSLHTGQIVLDLSCTKNGQKLLDSFLFENLEKCGLHKLDEHVKYSCRRYVLPLLGLESNATTRDHTAAAQSEQKNLVTLGNSQAQAVLLEDGSVHCEHELISPIRKLYLCMVGYIIHVPCIGRRIRIISI